MKLGLAVRSKRAEGLRSCNEEYFLPIPRVAFRLILKKKYILRSHWDHHRPYNALGRNGVNVGVLARHSCEKVQPMYPFPQSCLTPHTVLYLENNTTCY